MLPWCESRARKSNVTRRPGSATSDILAGGHEESRCAFVRFAAKSSTRRIGLAYRFPSIIVWVRGWGLVVQEIFCVARRLNLGKSIVPAIVETIREVVGQGISISERRQMVNL